MKKFLAIVVLGLLWCNVGQAAETLGEQLVKLESLYKRGSISKEEFTKAKSILLKMDSNSSKKVKQTKPKTTGLSSSKKKDLDKINLDKSNKKFEDISIREFRASSRDVYEKMEILFNEFRLYTLRPGTIRIDDRASGKKLAILSGNLNIKYFDKDAEGIFKIITHKAKERNYGKSKIKAIKEVEKAGGKLNKFLTETLNTATKDLGINQKELPGTIQLTYNGAQVLNWERIFVPKHRANFYQMTAFSTQEPFHYYVVTAKGNKAAFNMRKFGRRIDTALEKAKKKIAKEHNLTVEEVEYVIERKRKADMQKLSVAVGEETDKALSDAVEKQVSTQVASSIDSELAKELEETIGQASAQEMMAAIETSTGAQIDAALESQVASLIDDAVAGAIEEGYSQAAIEAGLAAYMETLAAGGTDAEAVAAADKAGCEADSSAC